MYPLLLKPVLKRARWGGRRLESLFNKELGPETDYAESWEVVDRGDLQSVVENGEWRGWTLHSLLERHAKEILGPHAGVPRFPLLIKLLDATDRLSVQVHPTCEQAAAMRFADSGKSEGWVILETASDSRLYVGVREGVDAGTLRNAIQSGTVEDCLHSFVPQPGDCVYVPAGTIHAIGEGIVLVEVQQSSDLTFRLYDWDRLGTDDLPRQLHIDEALRCADFTRGPVTPVVPAVSWEGSARIEQLIDCAHFILRRTQTDAPISVKDDGEPHVLMMLSGTAELACGGESWRVPRGRTVLLPADRPHVRLSPLGPCAMLDVTPGPP
jgi:mannose-6-phosphate isomerase